MNLGFHIFLRLRVEQPKKARALGLKSPEQSPSPKPEFKAQKPGLLFNSYICSILRDLNFPPTVLSNNLKL